MNLSCEAHWRYCGKALIWFRFFGDMAIEMQLSHLDLQVYILQTCVGDKPKTHIYWNDFLAINTLRQSCSPYQIHSLDIQGPFLNDPASSTRCAATLAPETWKPHHVSLCPHTSAWVWLWVRSSPSHPGSSRWCHINIGYLMNMASVGIEKPNVGGLRHLMVTYATYWGWKTVNSMYYWC